LWNSARASLGVESDGSRCSSPVTATEHASRLNALFAQAIDAERDHVVGFQNFGSGVAPRQGEITSLLQGQT
jgi:hypothetical protein